MKPKGKILRLKQGYNPNSSSIGTIVFALPASILGILTAFGVATSVITAYFLKKDSKSEDE